MAIRLKHFDHNTDGIRGFNQSLVTLEDVTATQERCIFVAPVACRIDHVDVFTHQGVTEATTNSVTINTMRVSLMADSASALGTARGNSANGVSTTNVIHPNQRYRLPITANNSLSVGTPIMLTFSQQGSAVLSAVLVRVLYTPFIHKETR